MNAEIVSAVNGQSSPVSRRLGVASLYVLLGNVFTLAVGLPLQIYISRVLGPSGVGVYGLLDAAMSTVAGLLGFGIGQTAMRFVSAHIERDEYGQALRLVRLGGVFLLVVGAAAYILLLLVLPWVDDLWPQVARYRLEAAAMGLLIPLSLLSYFFQQALRGFHEIRHVILGSAVLQLSVKAALTVAAFAVGLRLGGYILATVSGATCSLLWLAHKLRQRTRQLPRAPEPTSALPQWRHYALTIYVTGLLGAATASLDRFLVGGLIGAAAVGVLVIAQQLQSFPERFNQMLLIVGAPLLSAAHARGDRAERQHIYCLMMDWSVRCAAPLVLFLLFFANPILLLYGPEFAARGSMPVQILVAATFCALLCGPVGNVALMSGLERAMLYLSVAQTALIVLVFVGFIPRLGLIGAALGLACGILLFRLAVLILVRRKLHLRWWDKRYAAWLPQAGANVILALIISYLPWRLGAAELFAILVAMYALAAAVNVAWGLHEDDRDLLRHIWARVGGTT